VRFNLSLLFPVLFSLGFSALIQATATNATSGPTLTVEKPLIYEDSTQTVRAQKNASLRSNEFLLHADEILWDRNHSLVHATGNSILTARGIRLLCDSLILDLQSGDYKAQGIKAGFSSLALQADSIEKREGEIEISNPILSDNIYFNRYTQLSLSHRDFTFDENKSLLTTSPGWLKFGQIPITPIPPLKFKINKNKSSFSSSLTW